MDHLLPYVGFTMNNWSKAQQHIIEDAFTLDPAATIEVLTPLFGRGGATRVMCDMQKRFSRYIKNSDSLVTGDNSPLAMMDLQAMAHMLERSVFFTHNLEMQPHLVAQDYYNAAYFLEIQFDITIPL